MVGQSFERRQAVAQRLQEAREQQAALESLRKQQLPDGRLLGDADSDGFLFEVIHALQPVARRRPGFDLEVATPDGLRLRIHNADGAFRVEPAPAGPRPARPDHQRNVIDLRSVAQASAAADVPSVPAVGAPRRRSAQDEDDGSALSALLRRHEQ